MYPGGTLEILKVPVLTTTLSFQDTAHQWSCEYLLYFPFGLHRCHFAPFALMIVILHDWTFGMIFYHSKYFPEVIMFMHIHAIYIYNIWEEINNIHTLILLISRLFYLHPSIHFSLTFSPLFYSHSSSSQSDSPL